MRKSRTQDYLLLVLLIALVILASIGVWHLVAPEPLPEQSFDTRKVADPTEEKGYFYRGKEAMAALEDFDNWTMHPLSSYYYRKHADPIVTLDNIPPEDVTWSLTKESIEDYTFNVEVKNQVRFPKLSIKVKLIDCITTSEVYTSYVFKILNHPWAKTMSMALYFRNNQCSIGSISLKEYWNSEINIGRKHVFLFYSKD